MRLMFEDEDRKSHSNIVKEIIIWVICIGLSILAGFLVTKYAIEKTTMIGDSMNTTLNDGEEIIINKLAYKFSSPDRFDVIVFMQEGKEHSFYNIKRVIGLPGETICIKEGYVYVNNSKIDEKIAVDTINNPGLAGEPIVLGDDEYFVLGDNRNQSEDSRFANISLIKENEIIGEAWIRISPFGFIDKLNRLEDKEVEEE